MKTILYIYGFGGSPESTSCRYLRETLSPDKYRVLCPEYPQKDLNEASDFLEKYICENCVDLIVGSSLGGYIALSIHSDLPRVVINPCMMPSEELPKLESAIADTEMLKTYASMEDIVNHGMNQNGKCVIGLFAENDELLGDKYFNRFKAYYDQARHIPGGHHGNREAVPSVCQAIKDALKPLLFIDMDNVLADFSGYVKSMPDLVEAEHQELDEIPGIFLNFPVVSGAKEALMELRDEYELYILSTSPWNNPTALPDKMEWLKVNFGDMFRKRVIFSHHKNLCVRPDAWLIDDRPNHGACQFADHWIHFGPEGKYKTWDSVRKYLMEIALSS